MWQTNKLGSTTIPLILLASAFGYGSYQLTQQLLYKTAERLHSNREQQILLSSKAYIVESLRQRDYQSIERQLEHLVISDREVCSASWSDEFRNNSIVAIRTAHEKEGGDSKVDIKYKIESADCKGIPAEYLEITSDGENLGTLTLRSSIETILLKAARNAQTLFITLILTIATPLIILIIKKSYSELRLERERLAQSEAITRKLRAEQIKTGLALEGSNDGWWYLDLKVHQSILSPKLKKLASLKGRDVEKEIQPEEWWKQWIREEDHGVVNNFLNQHINNTERLVDTNCLDATTSASSGALNVQLRIIPINIHVQYEQNKDQGLFITVNDITLQKEQELKIKRLAYADHLTGLLNRRRFEQLVSEIIQRSKYTGQRFALILLDIDHFKELNDTYGHNAGDKFLIEAAKRIQETARPHGCVARIGGDEFTILVTFNQINDTQLKNLTAQLMEAIEAKISESYEIDLNSHQHTSSIGACLDCDLDGGDYSSLLDRADLALYASKTRGRGSYCFFDQSLIQAKQDRKIVLNLLNQKFAEGKTSTHFQRLVTIKNPSFLNQFETFGYEALFRVNETDISIEKLISIAEESGLIAKVTEAVLTDISARINETENVNVLPISINISPRQFLSQGFADHLLGLALDRNIPPSLLVIEITERAALDDLNSAKASMQKLRSAGMHFSLDDYGTGFTSITLLRSLPFSSVKIDKSFIQNMIDSDTDLAITENIIHMCRSLGLRVIAEGVETRQQMEKLVTLGCNHFQGFFFNAEDLSGDLPD